MFVLNVVSFWFSLLNNMITSASCFVFTGVQSKCEERLASIKRLGASLKKLLLRKPTC